MELSLRLSAIADMVTEGNRLVDVGCDHGYLPVYLMLKHKIPSAVAADVGAGPLSRAKEHISQYGLGKYIETRLCDGLRGIRPDEGDTLVIAGMGGPLMERILLEGGETSGSFRELILQPQSDIPNVRKFLLERAFHIVDEAIVLEDGKFYFLIKAVPGSTSSFWTEEEILFGRFLLREKNPVLKEYLLRELEIKCRILENMDGADHLGSDACMRRKEVEEEKRQILAVLEIYES